MFIIINYLSNLTKQNIQEEAENEIILHMLETVTFKLCDGKTSTLAFQLIINQ